MADYAWPDAQHRTAIGKPTARVDGPAKVSGKARYTYDVNARGMLYGAILRCPYPHATVVSIDLSAAEKMPGVKAVKVLQEAGTEIHWAGDEIAAVAAVDEPTAEDALRAIKVEYKQMPHLVSDAEPPRNIAVVEGPLSQDELIDMLQKQVRDREIMERLEKDGVTFKPSQQFLDTMKEFGVPERLVQAVAAAPVKPAVEKPHEPTWYKKSSEQVAGDPDAAFKQAEVVSEGLYGLPVITHCCLEPHGAVVEWTPDEVLVHISTQNVSGIAGQLSRPLDLPANKIRVMQQHIGGGFGSKFSPDRWTIAAAQLSKMAGGKPVKMMLDRASELEVAGARPSAYARVRIAANKDGTITGWQSESWGSGGPGGGGQPPIPYVFDLPNKRTQNTAIMNNIGPARTWRAPNHPQACLITMAALDDAAAKLGMDPMELFLKNIETTGPRAQIYRDELAIAADLSAWKQNWKPRGSAKGPVRRGLGLSIHTWGGRGHNSDCDLTLHPDGSVDIKLGTQDLGTGTRTAILLVAADTLGIPVEAIALHIGDSRYPPSGGSGGSTTIGGVSSSTRRAAVDARELLFQKVAPALKVQPAELEAVNSTVRVKGDPNRSLTWKQACAKLGAMPVTLRGKNPDKSKPPDLTNSGVGGVQVADVSVDTETGIVKINRMIAVQDCGLVINPKAAESQIYGAMIMGITYSLYEEKVMDQLTGRMLNPNLEFYRLAGISDIGELIVHLITNKYDSRGVIGLGEPPVVSPGAAISNAVANAIGVRVPFLPLTPDRVLAALGQKVGA
jgi:xanthine dehydrogenase YagR molybdenum-binding subunit